MINPINPMHYVEKINQNFPLLILQGNQDSRMSIEQGKTMFQALKKRRCNVTYLEIDGGNHCLSNISVRMDLITRWLNDK